MDKPRLYVLDTNVLIHDPQAPLNFHEHTVAIPMTVLEELDHLKISKATVATEARQAIRLLDKLIGSASPEQLAAGVPITRVSGEAEGRIVVLLDSSSKERRLGEHLNDNIIINKALELEERRKAVKDAVHSAVILVTKDINMRLKARSCGLLAEDYHTDQLVDDVKLLPKGFRHYEGSFWDAIDDVVTGRDEEGHTHNSLFLPADHNLHVNDFVTDAKGYIGWVRQIADDNHAVITNLHEQGLMHQEAWGLQPRDLHQGLAMLALMDPEIPLVCLTGAAGSGKTILALAAAIEQAMVAKRYRHIIVMRSVQGLDEDIGFLPGTETEKMLPWLGAITDNLEALHLDDENPASSIDYVMQKLPIQFKSLNYIRGRSFQQSFLIIDECQNLTPHQMKTIITRAGNGTKVVCLGNLAQIDTPYLSPLSSGLTYLTERFKNSPLAVHLNLQGVPRSALAEYAEAHL